MKRVMIGSTWRPHTETPGRYPATAIIAAPDQSDGKYFIVGVYAWDNTMGCWRDEETGSVPAFPFYWMDEQELLDGLPREA